MLDLGLLGNYILAALIGATVGSIELLGRYKDNPWLAVREPSAILYIVVNSMASLLAYHLVLVFGLNFGLVSGDPAKASATIKLKVATIQVLLAGLSAMAFFRSALFTVRVGNADIAIGPGLVIQVLLNAVDRSIDRRRAEPRAHDIPAIMNGVSFEKAALPLPAFCFGVMQNITSEEQTLASAQIATLKGGALSDPIKANLLGLLLVNLVGKAVLTSAVAELGDEIRPTVVPAP